MALAAERQSASGADVAPLVSVITPFLDCERFLEEAIQSVLAQTLTAVELLLIDDGSTDGSSSLARGYAARFPGRIRYLEHPGHTNRGKSVSRNLGIAQARGALLTFLDADDVFLPHKLEHQAQLLARHPQAVMAYGVTQYWESWGRPGEAHGQDHYGKLGVVADRLYPPPDLLVGWLRDPGTVPCICGLLARTAAVRATGGFDENIQDLYEDQVLLAKIVLSGPVLVESGCGERYRQHAESSSAIATREGRYHPTRHNPARLAYLQWLECHLDRAEHAWGELGQTLAGALRPYRYPRLHRVLDPLVETVARLRRRFTVC